MLDSFTIATQFAEDIAGVIFHARQVALMIGLFEMNSRGGVINKGAIKVFGPTRFL